MNDTGNLRDFKALWRDCGYSPQEIFELEKEAARRSRDHFVQEAQMKVYSCTCRSAWCEHCSKFCATSDTIRDRLSLLDWSSVRQVVLTVSREVPADVAMEKIRKNRSIAKLIKALGLKDRRWLWVLEFHADGYPHWHLFIENRAGKAGMIGKNNVARYWKHGHVWESYPKDKKHWGAITGYHRKAGYFAGETKKHQLTLPPYLMESNRVRKFASNYKNDLMEKLKRSNKDKDSGVLTEAAKQDQPRKPSKYVKKRVQKSYQDRLSACNTTCKVEKGGSWVIVDAPGSEVRQFAKENLDSIDYQTFQGTHEEIIDFILQIPGHRE